MLREKLEFVYGPEVGQATFERLNQLIEKYAYLKTRAAVLPADQRLSERDVVLITYGDQVQSDGNSHLQTLHTWLKTRLAGVINTVHILPFYPYTSDDGFSVVDYRQVDPALGDWADIRALRNDFRLMFDGVINHISASSAWFQSFLKGEEPYRDYFITEDPTTDLSGVTRPRTLPLLTPFETAEGQKYLWTTFSPDQLDLNFQNPEVFLNIADLLLFYASQGADLIRLDAIGYLWKEVGTSCIHLPQTHAIVQIYRALLDECDPNLLLITETNVPHRDNISYFGDGRNEAQMVYQFPLVPLVLHAVQTGNANPLREWAAGLEKVSDTATFFNFLASHDGIGVVPARNLLSEAEISGLVERALKHGGQVSYKNNPDGSQSPYELNITFFDALNDPNSSEPEETRLNRFIVSQAIMLALQGVPGIYFHSLLGSHSWQDGLGQTGRNRTLNREKLLLANLEAALSDPNSHAARVFQPYIQLISQRIAHPAFHPNAAQQILDTSNPALFAIQRTAHTNQERVWAIHNVSGNVQKLELALTGLDLPLSLTDLVSGQSVAIDIDRELLSWELKPYQVLWLQTGV